MEELKRLREEIDEIDDGLRVLFERRMACAAQIAEIKRSRRLPIRDPERERELLERNVGKLSDPTLAEFYRDWLRHTMALSRDWQAELWTRKLANRGIPLPGKNSLLAIHPGGLDSLCYYFNTDRRGLLVTDEGVPREYVEIVREKWALLHDLPGREWMRLTVVTVPQGERSKSVETWKMLLETMQQNGFTRDDCVVALGGGMVCDLAGFAAATYLRGIDCCSIPTTLLSMIDASFGGKTALNLGGAKNQIGAFSQPRRVLVDPETLRTLPERQIVSGLAEALKMAVCFDPVLFALFETEDLRADPTPVIEPCLLHKRRLVLEDEREAGQRKLLNFGHTIGHAIEAKTGLLHGECVGLGMLPMCSEKVRSRLLPIYEKLGLPTQNPCEPELLIDLIRQDKKASADGVDAIVVEEIGHAEIRRLDFDTLLRIVKDGGLSPAKGLGIRD